jgi:hypothetical protein
LWVTWRQHRAELVSALLLLMAVAAPLIATGAGMRDAYHDEGVPGCLTNAASRSGCNDIVAGFFDRYVGWGDQLTWLTLLPALAGVFVGAPLLGREFEHGHGADARCTAGGVCGETSPTRLRPTISALGRPAPLTSLRAMLAISMPG